MKDMDDGSSSSSSFDSDDEGDVGEESVESSDKHKLVMEAVCKSCENPYDYNLHLSALSALSGDRVYASQLEQQFERFHEAFPLSLELWLQYIELNPEKLPEAFQDYLLPALYYKYVDDLDDDDAKDAEVRWSVVLRALGSHWTECENVYHLYRAFLTDSIDDAATLNARVRSSYQGQLLNPYFEGSDRVLSEYRAWSQYQPNPADFTGEQDSIQRRIHSASPLLAKMQTFERNLDKADAADVSALQTLWLEYANFVVSRVSTLGCGVVVSVLERSVAAVCLSGELWGRYLTFLQDKRMKCLDVAKRAVRNVPFESAPWVALFVSMEMEGSTSAEAIHQVGADLCGRQPSPLDQEKRLEVLLAFCDAVRRSGSHEVLLQAFTMSKAAMGDWVVGKCALLMYESKCEPIVQRTSGLQPRWVELWDEVLQHRSHEVCAWQSCISECLRVGGTVEETRGYFKRGVAAATDYPVVLAEAWVVFERELGDHVQFWIEAKRHYALLLRQYYVSEVSSSDKSESRKRLLAAEDGSKTGKKEVLDRRQAEYKKQRLSDDTNKTVFLCELDKAITKDDLLDLFASCGHVTDVRMLLRNRESQASRGMAYVEFDSEAGAECALKLDKQPFHGTPLNIKPSHPPTKSGVAYCMMALTSLMQEAAGGQGRCMEDQRVYHLREWIRRCDVGIVAPLCICKVWKCQVGHDLGAKAKEKHIWPRRVYPRGQRGRHIADAWQYQCPCGRRQGASKAGAVQRRGNARAAGQNQIHPETAQEQTGPAQSCPARVRHYYAQETKTGVFNGATKPQSPESEPTIPR
ncbi:hypothetical protein, variant [Aphanomyces astaci]|uniref:RRM domain-containing protein n=1 Tax=Aphanomyces astaci TaxID=112090 RepID=W4G879_APHAT|nr:hypothetical protein, variant [Aphanomyces astaci]ETV75138.1 hypothetical protein, variant [Aphanomyces astaci]|eukprot:XP_009835185.1 hypothetical protein, variant [Aphanomyces astaci]